MGLRGETSSKISRRVKFTITLFILNTEPKKRDSWHFMPVIATHRFNSRRRGTQASKDNFFNVKVYFILVST